MTLKRVPTLVELNTDRTQRSLGMRLAGVAGVGQSPAILRLGTVVAPLINVGSYNVQMSGDGVTRTIPSIAPYAPVVGDVVRVAQIDGSYLVMSVVAGKVTQSGTITVGFVAVAAATGVITFPVAYAVGVTAMQLTVASANFDIYPNVTATTATTCNVRCFRPSGATTTTVTVHWTSSGV